MPEQLPDPVRCRIFDRVVVIDVIITAGANGHINQRMARQLIQHVVKKTNTCLIVVLASTI